MRRAVSSGGADAQEVRARLDGASGFLFVDGGLAGASSGGAGAVLAALRLLGEVGSLSYAAPFLALLDGGSDDAAHCSERTATMLRMLAESGAPDAERSLVSIPRGEDDSELTDRRLGAALEAGLTWLTSHGGCPPAHFPGPLRAAPLAVLLRSTATAALSVEAPSASDAQKRAGVGFTALAVALRTTAERYASFPFPESDALPVSAFPLRASWVEANLAAAAACETLAARTSAAAMGEAVPHVYQMVASEVEALLASSNEESLVYVDDAALRASCAAHPWPVVSRQKRAAEPHQLLPTTKRRAMPESGVAVRRRRARELPSAVLWRELVNEEVRLLPLVPHVEKEEVIGSTWSLLDELRAEKAEADVMERELTDALRW